MDDPFIRNYIEDLLKKVRTLVLLKLIKPYTRIRLPFISKVMVEVLMHIFLILDRSCILTTIQRKRSQKSCYNYHFCCISLNLVLQMQELNIPEKDVEELLVSLILDNRIHGHIDQVNRLLERGDR